MKIAVLGNSNNIGFSVMRYFRDLGAEAELLLYCNDGIGTHAHFRPEDDSENIHQWSPYIKRTAIPNHSMAALSDFAGWCHQFPRWIVSKLKGQIHNDNRISQSALEAVFAPYDLIIGCGIAPAVCSRINRPIDLFYPYAVGVEFIESHRYDLRRKTTTFSRLLDWHAKLAQVRGVQAARQIFNAEIGFTETVLKSLGTNPERIPLPMFYNREPIKPLATNPDYAELSSWLSQKDITFFTSARMLWTASSSVSAEGRKNNDWFFRALAEVKQSYPGLSCGVVAMEYGPDVQATKDLVADLNLSTDVGWLPLCSRSNVMRILNECDVAVGQFYEHPRILWGGTGWEALSAGKPLIHGFRFQEGEFEASFGYPPPAMYAVNDPSDLVEHLHSIIANPRKACEIGLAGQAWFNRYNGIGLARKWLRLLKESASSTPLQNTYNYKSIQKIV